LATVGFVVYYGVGVLDVWQIKGDSVAACCSVPMADRMEPNMDRLQKKSRRAQWRVSRSFHEPA
jgi:hypothetical protein